MAGAVVELLGQWLRHSKGPQIGCYRRASNCKTRFTADQFRCTCVPFSADTDIRAGKRNSTVIAHEKARGFPL
jgi:hypothetical protein